MPLMTSDDLPHQARAEMQERADGLLAIEREQRRAREIELQHEIANFGKQKDSRQKAATAKLKAAKAAVEKGRAALKAAQTAHSAALAESEAALAKAMAEAKAAAAEALASLGILREARACRAMPAPIPRRPLRDCRLWERGG